jgi:hypothetical protein
MMIDGDQDIVIEIGIGMQLAVGLAYYGTFRRVLTILTIHMVGFILKDTGTFSIEPRLAGARKNVIRHLNLI